MGTGDSVLCADEKLGISTWHGCLIVQIKTQCCEFGAPSPVIVSRILRE